MKLTPHDAMRLKGFEAAAIEIDSMLQKAEKNKPKRYGNPKSADFRSGAYYAFLAAHCITVYGEYPEHNKAAIEGILNKPLDSH